MKVDLQYPEGRALTGNEHSRHAYWKRSVPFVISRHGYLVHRVRSASTHIYRGETQHNSAKLWCGNSFNGTPVFLAEPPENRLICAVCEANAVAHGLPTSSDLVGRHVCVGRLRVQNACSCQKAEN